MSLAKYVPHAIAIAIAEKISIEDGINAVAANIRAGKAARYLAVPPGLEPVDWDTVACPHASAEEAQLNNGLGPDDHVELMGKYHDGDYDGIVADCEAVLEAADNGKGQ